jgi:hypothetical protein
LNHTGQIPVADEATIGRRIASLVSNDANMGAGARCKNLEAAWSATLWIVFSRSGPIWQLRHGFCKSAADLEDNWPLLELAASKCTFNFYERT